MINYNYTIKKTEYEKELRVKMIFSHLSHSIMKHHINIETNFDLKIKVEGPLKIERPT